MASARPIELQRCMPFHLRTVDKIARDIKKRAHMEGKFCKCRADLISQLTRVFLNVDLINKAIDDRVAK